jgi:hypothetical protein
LASIHRLDTCNLIEHIIEIRTKLDTLRKSSSPIEEINKVNADIEEARAELRKRKDYRECYGKLGKWTFPATIAFANIEILEDLFYYKKLHNLAIDKGLLFYADSGFEPVDYKQIRIINKFPDVTVNKITDPTEQDLVQGLEIFDADIQTYLRHKAKGGADGDFQNKISLTRITYPVKRDGLDQPLTLHVAPVSYWVIREFNREILKNPEPKILHLREKSLAGILTGTNPVYIPSPSALYVEVTLITRDQQVVILEKNRNLSDLAAGQSLSWTCTIEEGFVWTKDLTEGYLDLEQAIQRGLKQELSITPEQIESMEFYGLAMEYTHLNTALVGTIKLNVRAEDLVKGIKVSKDYGLSYEFVSVKSAYEELFVKGRDDVQWHPLARMRLLLTLINQGGVPSLTPDAPLPKPSIPREEIFISYSHKDHEWHSRLHTHLKPYFRNKQAPIWDDTKIKPGEDWDKAIQDALLRAKVAILLVSTDFLASDYVHDNELPDIFKAAVDEGLQIIWIAIRPSAYKVTSIAKLQCAHKNPEIALSQRSEGDQEAVLVEVAEYVASLF